MPRVFLSYSHGEDAHQDDVLGLARRLAAEDGIEVVLDRDVGPGGPDEGWISWSERQVREADRVLIVCSEEYATRYEGNDDGSDRGRGTVVEARAIQQFLYDSKGVNARFRVVLFDPSSHEEHIPHQLKSYHWFDPTADASYSEMVAWLKTDAATATVPAPEGLVWRAPDDGFKLPLADRRPHFDVVRSALSGRSSKRILMFEGVGNVGKTDFLNELTSYATRQEIPWCRVDFKGVPSIDDIFETLAMERDRGDSYTSPSPGRLLNLVNDLKQLTSAFLLLFDTFEKASDDARSWMETKFLPRVRNLPGVIVVVGGRVVPDKSQYPWRSLTELRKLEPIRDVEDWRDYLRRVHDRELELHQIETLALATDGSPGSLRPLLDNLVKKQKKGTE